MRREVFHLGQGVALHEDFDGRDPDCEHFLGLDASEAPVAAGRLRWVEDGGYSKAERVAVIAAQRGRGLGRAMMDAMERHVAERGGERLVLHAQLEVVPFYERLGYQARGPVFYEADIAHRRMERRLTLEPAGHQRGAQQGQGGDQQSG